MLRTKKKKEEKDEIWTIRAPEGRGNSSFCFLFLVQEEIREDIYIARAECTYYFHNKKYGLRCLYYNENTSLFVLEKRPFQG